MGREVNWFHTCTCTCNSQIDRSSAPNINMSHYIRLYGGGYLHEKEELNFLKGGGILMSFLSHSGFILASFGYLTKTFGNLSNFNFNLNKHQYAKS